MTFHIRHAVVAAGVTIGETLVVEAHEMEDRGAQVVDLGAILDGLESEFVSRTVGPCRLSRRLRPARR